MRPFIRLALVPLLLVGCQSGSATTAAAAPAAVAEPSPASATAARRPTVGILAFDGVQIIDYSGPYEVFGQAGYDVALVAERKAPLTTAMGQVVTPRYAFADAPAFDVLVVPGGEVTATQADPEVLAFVRAAQGRTRRIMSVCNGAFILAGAGLLDGKTVTTNYAVLDALQAQVPTARVVHDRRFVDNGQVITTAGLTSGLDGAMYVVAQERGQGLAQQIALNLEYDWRPASGYARAKLADMAIFRALRSSKVAQLVATGGLTIVRTEGDERRWTMVLDVPGQGAAEDVLAAAAKDLDAAGWQAAGTPTASSRSWSFRDPAGRAWTGSTTARDVGGQVRVEIQVALGT